jgi:hypothetical protein
VTWTQLGHSFGTTLDLELVEVSDHRIAGEACLSRIL